MKHRKRLIGLLLAGLITALMPLAATGAVAQTEPEYRVLVFAKTEDGSKNQASLAGIAAIEQLGAQNGFRVISTRDTKEFRNAYRLSRFGTIVFINTTGDVLNDTERANFEEYIRQGGGFVGIGAAIEAETDSSFFDGLFVTRASSRADVQTATVKVADRTHDASKDLPEYWEVNDAWYNYSSNVRGDAHVLATVVEKNDALGAFEIQPWGGSLNGIEGGTMGFDHPVAWCRDYEGGRSFYTGLGNTVAGFSTPQLRSHVLGAIEWAAGRSDETYSDCGATILSNYQQIKIAGQPAIAEPIGFDVLPDGRVLQTERLGSVRIHDPEANRTTVIGSFDVYSHSEDGMYGGAIDNNFEDNRHVYLFYSPAVVKDVPQSNGETATFRTPAGAAPNTAAELSAWDPWIGYFQLSRFTLAEDADGNEYLDPDSEEEILRVPMNRGACCHVAGDIDFDDDNNLWLVTGDDTPAGGGGSGGFSPHNDMMTTAGLYNAPHVDARRGALNTNDLRGKILRITVKDDPITAAEENTFGGAYTVPEGNLYPVGTEKTRPEVYAMGFRNPFRIQVDSNDVAYIADYSPDSSTPTQFRGPAGTGRVMVVREPSNYGWPLCYKTDLPYYRWNFNTTQPLDDPPQPFDCNNPDRGPQNNSRWNLQGGPTVEPGLEYGPPVTDPEVWYSFATENNATNPRGTPCFAYYGPDAPANPNCPRLFPEFGTGGVGPHAATVYEHDDDNESRTKFPAYYDGAVFFGEFTRDWLREIRLDSQGRVFKINDLLTCGAPNGAAHQRSGFECDNPMDLQFGDHDGNFYLLTYGNGFFSANPTAGMYRWEYVKDGRNPRASITATPTNGQAPLTVQFSSAGSFDPDEGDSITYAWDFDGNGTIDSVAANPTHTYTVNGQYTAQLTVTDSTGLTGSANTLITVGNTAPTVTITSPVEGGLFSFGDRINYSVTVTDPEDGVVDCSRVLVTFILGHDDHGHAQDTFPGCSGTFQTQADDVSHGGNVFGVISASYTDNAQAGAPALTTQTQLRVRQKRQEVEHAVFQQGTNVTSTTDEGGGSHRGSLGNGDWIKFNGLINLTNIDNVVFRTSAGSGANGTGLVEFRTGAPDGPIVQTFTIQPTANANTWVSQSFPVTNPGGSNDLYMVFRPVTGGPNNNYFNLNWVEFLGQGVTAGD